jgi:mono/diheme cytochrome c family protein
VNLRSLARGLLLWTVIATGCRHDAGSTAVRADVLETGGRVFGERCSPCHGATGHGNGPLADSLPIRPRNYHREPFKWGTQPSQIAATVRGGRSGVMPSFEGALTEREIQAVAYLVWSWVPADRREQDPRPSLEGAPRGKR